MDIIVVLVKSKRLATATTIFHSQMNKHDVHLADATTTCGFGVGRIDFFHVTELRHERLVIVFLVGEISPET